ncbi:PKD domain-containing protein [Actinoplanes sp. NPDC004185]
MRRTAMRVLVAVGSATVAATTLAVMASAVPVAPAGPRQGTLTQVGPLAEHGFPAWYGDTTGLRLEACTTLDDPLCPVLADEVPNPDQPVSYPDNFPGEFFYQLAGASLTLTGGARATVGLDLEGAWATDAVKEGDQMVFGRVRIRFAAPTGERYRITHPYGIDELVSANGAVNSTEDVGTVPGAFGGALNSRIGPFLKWDPAVAPAAPAGYTGNPAVEHRVVGSPYGTNFVKIERLDAAGAVVAEVGRTDLFSVQGRVAGTSGLTVSQATYTVGADGKGVIEVYATSDAGQALAVTGDSAAGFRTTRMRGQDGRYYARLPATGVVPAGVEVANLSDSPATRRTRTLTDVVTVSKAAYDATLHTLTVTAESSDRDATPGVLTVTGFGAPGASPFTDLMAPPATVTVTSSKGGSTTVPVTGAGPAMTADAPVAVATAPATATAGQTVTLDGSGSLGVVDSWAWKQTAGPAVTLTGATTAKPTFVAATAGTYTFQLVATGPGGVSSPATATIVVGAATGTQAAAGPDQTVLRGRTVTLDGSASLGANTLAWRQLSGPAVTLTGAGTAKPTFTLPLLTLPASPGPNAAYTVNAAPLTFELTATGPSGTSTDQVVVTAQAETLSTVAARYRTRGEWRISGTSDVLAGQAVVAVLGSDLKGVVVGRGTVDATGAFDLRPTTPAPGTATTVSIITATGGQATAVPITITS